MIRKAPWHPCKRRPAPTASRSGREQGFSLHAGVRLAIHQRHKLEHLCRYITRPAIANERLAEAGAEPSVGRDASPRSSPISACAPEHPPEQRPGSSIEAFTHVDLSLTSWCAAPHLSPGRGTPAGSDWFPSNPEDGGPPWIRSLPGRGKRKSDQGSQSGA